MSKRRNNHRNKRTSGGRGHWIHPTKGYRRERADAREGLAILYAFAFRALAPAEALDTWGDSERS